MAKNIQKKGTFKVRVNNDIRYETARVIYKEKNDTVSENDFNRVMSVYEAKKIADKLDLDLIEINERSTPPILKIYDYTKYVWEMKQLEKKKRKNVVETKEIQLSVNISLHDMETKARHAKEFIEKGHKVRIVLTMKGRELTRRDESSKSFYEFLEIMGNGVSYDLAPKNEGNKLITIIKKK